MKSLITCLAAVGLVATALAQPSTPSPENKLLSQWYGDWVYKGQIFDTSKSGADLSPASTFTGTWTGRAVLGGNASEFVFLENGVRFHEIDYWNPEISLYGYFFLAEDGYNETGTYWMEGTTCKFSSTWVGDNGIEYTLAGEEPISKDGRTVEKIITLTWTTKHGKKMCLPYLYEKATKVSGACGDRH